MRWKVLTIAFAALFILSNGFSGGPFPGCLDAADADDNGDYFPILESLYILGFGFIGGPPPPDPHPNCGGDPTLDDLGCEEPPCP